MNMSNVSVCCQNDVAQSLQSTTSYSAGFLIGYEHQERITVLTWAPYAQKTGDISTTAKSISLLLPAGISIVGIFCSQVENVEADLVKLNTTQLQNDLKLNHLLTLYKTKESSTFDSSVYLQSENGVLNNCSFSTSEEDVFSQLQMLRLKTVIPLDLSIPSSSAKIKNHIIQGINKLVSEITSPESTAVFHIENSPVLLLQSEGSSNYPPEANTCGDLPNHIITDNDEPDYLRGKKKKGQKKQTISVSLLFQATGDQACNKTQNFSPVINYLSETFKNICVTLPLDVVALVDSSVKCDQLWDILAQGVANQLRAMEKCLINQVGSKQITMFQTPAVYHYRPLECQTLVTVIYPDEQSDVQLENQRRELHELLGYSADRPLFRAANVFLFPEEVDSRGYLRDPHIGLPSSKVAGGKCYLVQGHYSYHHYMQDRFDDDKWGCAYRSLQTLVSWFILQGYSSISIPTHRDIQQALVDVGDKDGKFVGSRQWIGSFEVSICLDQFLGVSSKILSVSEGADLAYKGRELAMHFETQGTPVMIGGGVLAHTILGVDFNSETGAIKFLILDPHYTGAEDLKLILDKGWCGWKGPDFWDQTAHYNLCMPQRNIEF